MAGGRPVPGARDVTLEILWRRDTANAIEVSFTSDAVRTDPALSWVHDVGWRTSDGMWCVDREDWIDRALWPLTIEAPELVPHRLVDVAGVATLLGGVKPSTVTSYLARGRLPVPQVTAAGRPLWSLPVLLAHIGRRE